MKNMIFAAANIKDLIHLVGDYDFVNNTFYFKIRGKQIYKWYKCN